MRILHYHAWSKRTQQSRPHRNHNIITLDRNEHSNQDLTLEAKRAIINTGDRDLPARDLLQMQAAAIWIRCGHSTQPHGFHKAVTSLPCWKAVGSQEPVLPISARLPKWGPEQCMERFWRGVIEAGGSAHMIQGFEACSTAKFKWNKHVSFGLFQWIAYQRIVRNIDQQRLRRTYGRNDLCAFHLLC